MSAASEGWSKLWWSTKVLLMINKQKIKIYKVKMLRKILSSFRLSWWMCSPSPWLRLRGPLSTGLSLSLHIYSQKPNWKKTNVSFNMHFKPQGSSAVDNIATFIIFIINIITKSTSSSWSSMRSSSRSGSFRGSTNANRCRPRSCRDPTWSSCPMFLSG